MFDATPVESTLPLEKLELVPLTCTPDPTWIGSPFPEAPCIWAKISPKFMIPSLYPTVLRFAKLFEMRLSHEESASKPESGIAKDDIYLPPVWVRIVDWAGAPKLPYRFISADGP